MIEVTDYRDEGVRVLARRGGREIGRVEPVEKQRPPKRGFRVVGDDRTIYGTVTGAVVAVIMAHTRRNQ